MEGNKGYPSGNDLFVCFPSRASIRMMQRSILSPGRIEKSKENGFSGSRRKGGHSSPMFPVVLSRKNVSSGDLLAEEDEEPSSPKVTCIGQVRVKSKQRKGAESLKRWGSLMIDFRKEVCHGLRSLGVESSCFFACSRSCSKGEEEHGRQHSTCGSTGLAKWFMVLHEGDEKKHGKLDPDAEEREKSVEFMDPYEELKNPCAKNKEKMYPDDEEWTQIGKFGEEDDVGYCGRNGYGGGNDEEEEEPTCIPPRNALLLMRCRSEPLRVYSRHWTSDSNDSEPYEPTKGRVCQDSNRGRMASSYGDKASDNDKEPREVHDSEATAESLPQALVLMRCQPELTKLSLEICKETWVSSKDFLRKPVVNRDNDSSNMIKGNSDQEGFSSGAEGMRKMPGEKFSPAEAFMLKRCNSEPLKLSVKLAPEACLWKRRNLGQPLTLNI